VALGNAGAVNAALLAVQILALSNPHLTQRLVLHKKSLADKVAAADEKIQAELNASRPG
jgi:phosphoribosylcarboxyaminoimidazole (NCAIR) mutase